MDAGGDKDILKVMEVLKLNLKAVEVRVGNCVLSGNVTSLHECRDALHHLRGNMASNGKNVHLLLSNTTL
jgi:hypothetical protein